MLRFPIPSSNLFKPRHCLFQERIVPYQVITFSRHFSDILYFSLSVFHLFFSFNFSLSFLSSLSFLWTLFPLISILINLFPPILNFRKKTQSFWWSLELKTIYQIGIHCQCLVHSLFHLFFYISSNSQNPPVLQNIYIYIYVCVCVCVCLCLYIYIYIYECAFVSIYIYVYETLFIFKV